MLPTSMSLCIMHLLQIAPAWKKQFLQGHIHCTWNQTSDSQLTSMQALADADIELENAFTWGRIAALPGNCRFHLIEWSFLVASGCGWSKCMTSPRRVPIATGHEQEILAPVVTIAPVLCMFLEFLCILKKTSFTFSPRKLLLEKVRAPEFSRFLFQKLPEPVQQVVYHLTQKIRSKSWSLGWTELNCVFWGISKLSKVLS